jgi:glycosyltransferase involved in cell wall biosynthesis
LAARGRKRAKLRLSGDIFPSVDVFVTCCNEDVDVVLDTTRAACAVDYPQARFRVIVCDDGADPDLRTAVENLSLTYRNLYYHARIKIKGKPHHFKAGNLIAATEMVEILPGGAGDFIAALDADMIPEPDWLRAVISHMVKDPGLALVCPPQLFYNVPNNDPLVQSLDAFVHVMEPVKDANGVAWCTGSGYAIRRTALESIGGWPTGSLAEDVYTSSKLLGAGWSTAFVHEALQFGTVPDTFTGHLKQRTRWTLGTLQTALKLNFCLYGDTIKGMTFFQRLSGFVFTIDAFFKIFLMIALLTIPIVLCSGGTLVAYTNAHQLRWQIRLSFINLVLTRLQEWIAYLPSGYRLAQRDSGAQMWMAPYHSLTIIKSFLLPSWLGGKPMAFSSSGSVKSELNERDAKTRASLMRRVKVTLWDCNGYIHLAYVIFVIVAVSLSISRAPKDNRSPDQILLYLLTHAFWPPMLWLLCLTAYAVPLSYAIWPPTVPDREDLLDRDEKTQIAHPKTYWKQQRWRRTTFWHETQYSFCTVYTTVIFFGSFFVY